MKSLILTVLSVTASNASSKKEKDPFGVAFSYQNLTLTKEIEQCKAAPYKDKIKSICESNARDRAKTVCDMAYHESMQELDHENEDDFKPILTSFDKINRCYNDSGNGVYLERQK